MLWGIASRVRCREVGPILAVDLVLIVACCWWPIGVSATGSAVVVMTGARGRGSLLGRAASAPSDSNSDSDSKVVVRPG